MKLFRTPRAYQAFERTARRRGLSIGFVPTMGALHAGHAALLKRAKRENDLVVLSVFVNPTQFDDPRDFAKYPKTLANDCELARRLGVDAVFAPNAQAMYPDSYRYRVSETELSRTLCGAHRPGHFEGMLTVVLKLLMVVRADRAYFGEKDYQQLELVRGMVDAFFLPTRIVACRTVRERDGLALSSRNARLSPVERALAPEFARVLSSAYSTKRMRAELERRGFEVDYVEKRAKRVFGAVRLGQTRLIDNVSAKE